MTSKSGRIKKRIDPRIKTLIEESVRLNHRSLLVVVGKRGKSQIVNLHWMLQRCHTSSKSPHARSGIPSVLWCYDRELGFSPNHVRQVQKLKSMIRKGLRRPDMDDPFEAFVLNTELRYVRFKDSERVLGQTFDYLVLQDFECITPNLLARTVETVRGGGIITILLDKISHLKQLFTLTMDVHKRFRTPSHQVIVPRFNERFTLSLADCVNCLIMDDELTVMPITSAAQRLVRAEEEEQKALSSGHLSRASPKQILERQQREQEELRELQATLRDTKPIGDILGCCRTCDQAKAVMVFLDAIADKSLSSTVVLTAARGRGKSAALGLAVAGAIALQYANIFVTSPSPENLRTLFEVMLLAFDSLGLKEHSDYEIVQSTNPEFHRAIVRINVFRKHRQTIQYISPADSAKLSQAELLIVDEAAAIPLPLVKALFGPYLVFLSSTVNGYEGTGRSLSLKLVKQLRSQAANAVSAGSSSSSSSASAGNVRASAHGRKLRELQLNEPIRYGICDAVETWLTDLLCLNCCSGLDETSQSEDENSSSMDLFSRGGGLPSSVAASLSLRLWWNPSPSKCELFSVNRDTLFSYNRVSEFFLQKMMSLYVSSHYKNQPNDLQLMSDAPSHQLFVLLAPREEERAIKIKAGVDSKVELEIPDILAVVQVCLEGELTKKIIRDALAQGKRLSGDMIPWIMSQQFQDDDFGRLSGARVVRIAVHPHVQGMGYGTRALQLLIQFYSGMLVDLTADAFNDDGLKEDEEMKDLNADDEGDQDQPTKKRRKLNSNQLSSKTKKKGSEGDANDSDSDSSSESSDARMERIRRKKGEKLAKQNTVSVRAKLPPLLTPVTEMRPQRLHWIGTAFGLTGQLFKFWKKSEFEPVYIRQTPNEVTGEYTSVMIKPLLHSDTENDMEWIKSFSQDFTQRFSHLLSYDFNQLDLTTALWVLNPDPLLLQSDQIDSVTKKKSQSDIIEDGKKGLCGPISKHGMMLEYRELNELLSEWDMKRLEKYCRSLFDYRLILDLIPKLTRLFFDSRLDIQLNYHQCCILAGIGFQRKSMTKISKEMGLKYSQTVALMNKSLKKMHLFLESVIEGYVQKTDIEPRYNRAAAAAKQARMVSDPHKSLRDELAKEGRRKEAAERRQLMEERKKKEDTGQQQSFNESDSREHRKKHEKQKRRAIAHLKEYSVSSLDVSRMSQNSDGIKDSISVKVSEMDVEMPKEQIDGTVDPASLRRKERLSQGKIRIKGDKKRRKKSAEKISGKKRKNRG